MEIVKPPITLQEPGPEPKEMSGSVAAVEASVIHISSSNSELVQRVKASFEAKINNVDCSEERKKSLRARYFYGIIFLITNLTAWFIRDYGKTVFPPLYYKKACGISGHHCFHTLGVLRVSLGCFIFFFLMFLTTFSTRKLYEACSKWHLGWWGLKFILLLVSMVAPFFLPSDFIQIYGEVARIGAGIFLLLQLISIIEFIRWWNKYWAPAEQSKQSSSVALVTSIVFYVASIGGIVSMYYFYAPRPACALNIFFITWTAILLIAMMSMSLHSKVNRGLLSSGIMASYVVFLCWSAIRSEPADEKCNAQKPKDGHVDWTSILGFLIAIGAIVMATFSTGIDSKSFQFRKDEVKLDDDDIRYNYGFFHMVFSLGAMYFAMLFISWNLEDSASKWRIDVGWASTWVKIINEWVAASIYMWKLIAPAVKQPKVANIEESVHQNQTNSNSTSP